MNILIIEPSASRQRQLRTILTSIGHKSGDIEAVADAKTAVSRLAKKRFDCSFLSMFPPLNALDLLKEVGFGCGSKSLPLIVYSSEVTREKVIAAAEAGAMTFLAYPFSVNDVEHVIRVVLSR